MGSRRLSGTCTPTRATMVANMAAAVLSLPSITKEESSFGKLVNCGVRRLGESRAHHYGQRASGGTNLD